MEAIGLFFSKFSDELLSAQIALLSFSLALGVYWMLVRKKKRETAEWVPAALVKAYLDRTRKDERETRARLFGEDLSAAPQMPLTQMLAGAATTTTTVVSNDPALVKEIEALRGQLSLADSRAMEFDKTLNGMRAEKAALEQKLKDAANAAPAAGGAAAPNPALAKELEDLRAKLQEYEVIEDDLANLKKFQKENDQLKQRISQLEGGGAPTLTVVQGGAQPAAEATTIPAAPAKAEAPAAAAAPAPAPAAPPAPAPAAAAPAPEKNTNVLAPVTPTVDAGAAATPAAAAAPANAKQKEEELLSEFEKMLAS